MNWQRLWACRVKRELFTQDLLHLSQKGYEAWSDGMQPLVAEMLNGS